MFENVLFQSAPDLLADDIRRERLPGSLLFAGPPASGKLTCALELARVLSCREKGLWNCTCPSCRQHKALVSSSVLVTGPGNRSLEIAAARNTLLAQNANNTSHLEAARYLYLRAVRKLTVRFSPILWEGDDKSSKFAPLLQAVDEDLEQLNPGRVLPDGDHLEKITADIEKQCTKLEDSFLYDALPVSQIRNFSAWAHLSSAAGRKILIIENADVMADSARNALLKILEEPPEDVTFILTSTRRGAMLPTILSRVRTYTFFPRTQPQQQTVIERVFHYAPRLGGGQLPESIHAFLQMFLPVQPAIVHDYARQFFRCVASGHVPDIPQIVSGCGGFSPSVLFTIFLQELTDCQRSLASSAAGAEASARLLGEIRSVAEDVRVFNLNPAAALERLTRSFMQVNMLNDGIFRSLVQEAATDE
ncbi:MAG TPA: DNA polymerase III [Treponema sp.]|nr:DNA polymerase III [Treponema sp.]